MKSWVLVIFFLLSMVAKANVIFAQMIIQVQVSWGDGENASSQDKFFFKLASDASSPKAFALNRVAITRTQLEGALAKLEEEALKLRAKDKVLYDRKKALIDEMKSMLYTSLASKFEAIEFSEEFVALITSIDAKNAATKAEVKAEVDRLKKIPAPVRR
ncbi:MAG TPA: hypothetical protein VM901_11190 [Bdellovibrionota bacterium]|nr:hypothetical protein [Bdellovibrionota bacterium]